jgi:hypothetical protein
MLRTDLNQIGTKAPDASFQAWVVLHRHQQKWQLVFFFFSRLQVSASSAQKKGMGKELARSCRCGGGGPTHALPPRGRVVTQPIQLEAPPARGHATKCPVSPGAPCLLFLRSSSIESLVLVSAPPVCRAVARLAELLRAPKEYHFQWGGNSTRKARCQFNRYTFGGSSTFYNMAYMAAHRPEPGATPDTVVWT